MKKTLITLLVVMTLITAAFAANEVTVTEAGNFHIYYNDVEKGFTDVNGTVVRPIVLEGTTYLPVRAASELVGLSASWNGETSTVTLTAGSGTGCVTTAPAPIAQRAISATIADNFTIIYNNTKQSFADANGKAVYPVVKDGTTYLPIRALCSMLNIPVEWDGTTSSIYLGTHTVAPIPAKIVIIDDDICTMKITEIDPNGDWGFTFKVYCENKTNHAVGFYIDYASVNGYMCDPFWGTELPAGKKENSSFEFSHSTLRDLGVTSLDELELGLRIVNADDWSADPLVDDVYTIFPTGLSASDVVYTDRTHMPDEVVCVDDDNCTFVILSVDPDGDWGYTLKCYLENKTDSMMQFYWDDVAVNGFMVDPYWGDRVAAGKRCYSEISFSQSQLDENSITTIDEIEFNLQVTNEDDWNAVPYVDTSFSYKPVN